MTRMTTTTLCISTGAWGSCWRFLFRCFFFFFFRFFVFSHDLAGGPIFAHLEFISGAVYIPDGTGQLFKKRAIISGKRGVISRLQTRLLLVGKELWDVFKHRHSDI